MSKFQGLKIKLNENATKGKFQVDGSFSTFVSCGSQYAMWSQFPKGVIYFIKDIKTNQVYESINNELSISWNGNEVYQEFSKKSCNEIVTEEFSVFLGDIYFEDAPAHLLESFELVAKYLKYTSNRISIESSNFEFRKF